MKTIIAAYSQDLSGLTLRSALRSVSAATTQLQEQLRSFMQLLSILQWIFSFLVMGLAFLMVFICLFFTHLWPISALYLSWVLLDWDTPETGGRRSEWVRNCSVWNYFRDYFPIQLVKTHNLPPGRNYIIGSHPHGILCIGAFCNFVTESTGFSQKFPGIRPHLTTLTGNFRLPILREYMMSGGLCPVNRKSIGYALSQKGRGNAVVIVVGGAAESLSCQPGVTNLILSNRRGFVRLALEHGIHRITMGYDGASADLHQLIKAFWPPRIQQAHPYIPVYWLRQISCIPKHKAGALCRALIRADLVPSYSFGETDLYQQVHFTEGSLLHAAQHRFQKLFGFAPCFFYGRGLTSPQSKGFIPYSRPITTVIGEPVTVPQIQDPSPEIVDRYHNMYKCSLLRLFHENKTKHGLGENAELRIL
ncbi:diacylglycerol O-acyltransferase 2-like isoform X1 [Pseudophryne corroboree]|uniref:diacylglycerol O-acyltransferase 2-like isoform X1 n=1 Tax=Pseudophryne corroboree TaxID=495146 RepID=UPI0030816F28